MPNLSASTAMNGEIAGTLALQALVWILGEEDRAARLLALTGLDAGALRAQAGDPATHGAILDYLAGYEPDLLACADTLDIAPQQLVAAQLWLSGGPQWG